ncbi:hypothetical protein OIU76_015739 [Salix suchowensis]|uniref:CASP-like protein n=3 Tax=Salix TaxID=40685 RepID=A0A9Q0PRP9_SALPP|nr:hypothetical protein OIU76_015739 [Salix suchowensis]KAJ6386299.1 hypothetical protein OIU77_029301 [Salix suchowensis]KAJ6693101.1 CASPARIAN STRIP MEMBRANE PROTEIN 4 [Salix purpurea]
MNPIYNPILSWHSITNQLSSPDQYYPFAMDSDKSGEATKISIQEPKAETKGKGIIAGALAPVIVAAKAARRPRKGWKKGAAIFDLVLRLSAIVAGFAATSLMGTTDQTLPFFTQFFQFHAQYNDLPTFLFFVIANAIASGYLVLSLPFSIVCIIRSHASGPRLLLLILDSVMMGLTTSAASASAAIVYLAHNGNSSANWNAFCQQFGNFCQQVSSAVVASLIAATLLLSLVVVSAFALRKMK